MTILAIAALVILIVSGVLVLRLKSDPMENEAVKKALADSTRATTAVSPDSPQASDSTPTKNLTPKT
jgi:uncharacterized membrane-anchored protein YhcB (DUF1043 family)